MVKSDAYPAVQSYGFEALPVGREEKEDFVLDATGRAEAVKTEAAARTRVEVRILIAWEQGDLRS